jgi:hypothetical protein
MTSEGKQTSAEKLKPKNRFIEILSDIKKGSIGIRHWRGEGCLKLEKDNEFPFIVRAKIPKYLTTTPASVTIYVPCMDEQVAISKWSSNFNEYGLAPLEFSYRYVTVPSSISDPHERIHIAERISPQDSISGVFYATSEDITRLEEFLEAAGQLEPENTVGRWATRIGSHFKHAA